MNPFDDPERGRTVPVGERGRHWTEPYVKAGPT
jgi:hypothetical protein